MSLQNGIAKNQLLNTIQRIALNKQYQKSGHCNSDDMANDDHGLTTDEFSLLCSAEKIGTWKLDLVTQHVYLSAVAAEQLEFAESDQITLTQALRQLYILNAGHILIAFKKACQTNSSVTEIINLCDHKTGEPKWLNVSVNIFYSYGIAVKMIGTITDITATKKEAQRRMDLMAFLNHELKTPLSVAKLYMQTAYKQSRKLKLDTISHTLAKADLQTIRMADMMDNFLTLSRMEVAPININYTHFDLTKLIEEIAEDMAMMYPDRQFKIVLGKTIMVNADRDKLMQVLNNYITNAIKYSDSGLPVKLSCKQIGANVKVAVSDKGPGISPADQQFLFNRYCRVHDQNTIRAKGFGLGLFLSREIIECHGGNVWVKSALGEGSTFGFTIKNIISIKKTGYPRMLPAIPAMVAKSP